MNKATYMAELLVLAAAAAAVVGASLFPSLPALASAGVSVLPPSVSLRQLGAGVAANIKK